MSGSDVKKFLTALKQGNLTAVKSLLDGHPGLMHAQFVSGSFDRLNSGDRPLHVAAVYNHPEVIGFLVNEMGVDVHQLDDRKCTALHRASERGNREAVETLLQLGADPRMKDLYDRDPAYIAEDMSIKCMLNEVVAVLALREKSKTKEPPQEPPPEKKEESVPHQETWSHNSPVEVMSERTLRNGLRLTNIFNFKTRCWMLITEGRKGAMTQNVLFFDDIPDKEILKTAHTHLVRLGGTADAESIDRRPIDKPNPGKI